MVSGALSSLRLAMQRAVEPTQPPQPARIITMDQIATVIRRIEGELVHAQGEHARLEDEWTRLQKEYAEQRTAIDATLTEIGSRLLAEREKLAAMVRDCGIRAEVPKRRGE